MNPSTTPYSTPPTIRDQIVQHLKDFCHRARNDSTLSTKLFTEWYDSLSRSKQQIVTKKLHDLHAAGWPHLEAAYPNVIGLVHWIQTVEARATMIEDLDEKARAKQLKQQDAAGDMVRIMEGWFVSGDDQPAQAHKTKLEALSEQHGQVFVHDDQTNGVREGAEKGEAKEEKAEAEEAGKKAIGEEQDCALAVAFDRALAYNKLARGVQEVSEDSEDKVVEGEPAVEDEQVVKDEEAVENELAVVEDEPEEELEDQVKEVEPKGDTEADETKVLGVPEHDHLVQAIRDEPKLTLARIMAFLVVTLAPVNWLRFILAVFVLFLT
ncbi:hypothetical protein G6011_05225 [Alternaria panax]|uniref:Uncharacterized protein n=1 Tax=Alternaria panax TaxID=48097 RepID=A0AAD4FGW0_9PLEO|nr:hypothetical protein G6011_05225 [Alternaria panax]